jgi:hypothetical protein
MAAAAAFWSHARAMSQASAVMTDWRAWGKCGVM